MITEEYSCNVCDRRVLGWSFKVVEQLNVAYQQQFPCILTSKYACDKELVLLMRNRGLGNSCSQMAEKILENHSEAYTIKAMDFFNVHAHFTKKEKERLVTPTAPPLLPPMPRVPQYRWLAQVYLLDVLVRQKDIKAAITSVHGRILKMDSTKKICKKLAGAAEDTGSWVTNIGNEHNQILVSVLTAKEGCGLDSMLNNLMRRYEIHNIEPPVLFYVDRDCCGPRSPGLTLKKWDKLVIRMDVSHFMRRFSCAISSESHPLFPSFMSNLSSCIFEWDNQDVVNLILAKQEELKTRGILNAPYDVMVKSLSMKELALHCKRQTRGVDITTRLIEHLLDSYSGERGRDTLGVELIIKEQMAEVWSRQKEHIKCIQDLPGVQLYQKVGTISKFDVELSKYRCARGTTSLENFHLHLNRFIPGTRARDALFQAYLLDGISRWNQDRTTAATTCPSGPLLSYSSHLRHESNRLADEAGMPRLFPSSQELFIHFVKYHDDHFLLMMKVQKVWTRSQFVQAGECSEIQQ